jgi:hypothetical protein
MCTSLLVSADHINILSRGIHTEALVVSSKEAGLEANAVKTSTMSCLKIKMQDKVQYKD